MIYASKQIPRHNTGADSKPRGDDSFLPEEPSVRHGGCDHGCARAALQRETGMAVNKPKGDNARKGAVKKRTQLKAKLGGATAWTKRNKKSGAFMAVKKPAKKTKTAKKFKGVRSEN
jgi:hypothetical protein